MKTRVDADEKLRQIEHAAMWLESFGLQVRNTRYEVAKRTLLKGIKDQEVGPDDMVRFQWALQELDDFMLVHQFLTENSAPPIEVLAKSLKGCLDGHSEVPGRGIAGRNFVFELVIASRFAMLGCDVRFEGDADCIVRLANFDVFVECKRSIGKDADSGLKTAFKQIIKRCESTQPSKSFGIAAVCYTPIVMKESLAEGPLVARRTLISKNMLETSANFKFGMYGRYCPPGLGVITHFTVPFWEEQDMSLTLLRRTNFHRIVPEAHPAAVELRKHWRSFPEPL